MKRMIFVLVLLLIVSLVFAQTTQDYKAKVKELQKKASAKLTPEQKANISKLEADLKKLQSESSVTQEQKDKLKADLIKCLAGIQKPSQESIQKFATDLALAFLDKELTPSEVMALYKDVLAILMSMNIPQEDAEAIIKDVQEIVKASNVSKEEAMVIVADVKAIIDTAKAAKK